MSGENGRYTVGIEMDELEEQEDPTDLDCQPVEEEETVVGPSFKDRFKSILVDYYDEKTWWVAVEDYLKKDGDFAEKVGAVLHSCLCSVIHARLAT